MGKDGTEEEVAEFVHLYLKSKDLKVAKDDVSAALKQDTLSFCGAHGSITKGMTFAECAQLMNRVIDLVEREQRVRNLGRDLQLTATSYELPISDLPGQSQEMSKNLQGIISIWRAGTGSAISTSSGIIVRTKTIDLAAEIQALGTVLNRLSKEERIAAVWRYQYGFRLVKDDRAPDYPAPYKDSASGPGTERQYLFKNWSDVENALNAIWEKIRDEPVSPPLTQNEILQYVFPENVMKNLLPDNVILWGRVDLPSAHPFGDVGLQWKVPLEPVLPSLTTDTDAILGGNYPPNPETTDTPPKPVDGAGLCSDPVEKRGYLCRPFTTESGTRCPNDPTKPIDPDKISLVTCEDKSDVRTTMSGPDVCREVDIREDHTFDPQRECTINFRCAPNCGSEMGGGVDATTSFKKGDGTIEICMDSNKSGGGWTPLMYHELVHAYQSCTFPPNYDPYAGKNPKQKSAVCCELEGGGYRAQCDMAEEDGAFDGNPTFTDPITGEKIPINADSCAEALTNGACGPGGYSGTADACYTSRTYPAGFRNAVFNQIATNPKELPNTCAKASAFATMDQRVRDLIEAIENHRNVCGPGQTEVYKNTIGNNACYIGQCIEESTELYRVTGAQSPFTVGDQSFPWNDPLNGSALGNALVNPPLTPSQFPPYRPQLVVQQMEAQLCQLQGLPPLTPSILCSYNPGRRLFHPLLDPIGNTQSLLADTEAQMNTTDMTLALSLGLGSRIGTTMYADYMHVASHSLADILGMAVKLFKEMSSVDFPTEMCPTDNTLPPPSSATGT